MSLGSLASEVSATKPFWRELSIGLTSNVGATGDRVSVSKGDDQARSQLGRFKNCT
jgi:hypothetical protein